MRAWEGGGGGRKLLGFGRHASSPPLLFIELLLPPPLGGWRAMPCLPRCGGGCLFLPLREEDAFFNRSRCPAIAVLGWIGKAEGEGRADV
jgi:hypothetical protein